MSMIIHYWKHPTVGGNENSSTCSYSWNGKTLKYKFLVDSNKFEYEKMPNKLTYRSPLEEQKAIGKLLFACGVTVKMASTSTVAVPIARTSPMPLPIGLNTHPTSPM